MKKLLLICFLMLTVPAYGQTPLANLANSMQPGAWAELATANISVLNQPGSSGNIIEYAADAAWNPLTRKFCYIGNDHIDGNTAQALRYVCYDEPTNTWQNMPVPPFSQPGSTNHGYYHHAVNPANGDLYRRRSKESGTVFRLRAGTWTALPTAPIETSYACCGTMDYFPELGGLVLVQGGENGGGSVYFFSEASQAWSKLADNLAPLTGSTFMAGAYSPTSKTLIFGQGGSFYKLDAARTVTPIAAPPFVIYDGTGYLGVLVTDPVSGKFIALSASSRNLFSFDTSWQALGSTNKPNLNGLTVIAAPVSNYGVIMFVSCYITNCRTHLYKYAASTPVPQPTPEPTPTPVPNPVLPLGPLTHDGPATPEQLSLLLPVTGSLPQTATAAVRHKVTGTTAWIPGHALFRIQPSFSDVPAIGAVVDAFAWPILGLNSGTSYDVEVTVTSGTTVEVKTATFVTRALPAAAGPANKNIAAGSSAATIQTALDGLNAGDVIQFADGTFPANLILRRSGTAASPITIRGTSRTGTVLSGNRIFQVQNASNVILENFTGQGAGVDSGINASSVGIEFYDGTPNQSRVTVRNVTFNGVDRCIGQSAGITEALFYDNTCNGNNPWTSAFIDSNLTWNDDGINLGGTGNVAFNNTLKGFGDCLAYASHAGGEATSPSIGIHFYRNDLRNCGDDPAEADHSLRNNSLYDNRIHNSMTFLSLDPLYGGPFVAARNVAINIGRTPFKWNSTNSGQFVFNNTVVRTTGKYKLDGQDSAEAGWYQANNGSQRSYGFQNNLLIYRGTGTQTIRLDNSGHSPVDFTHNSWFPDLVFQWPEGRYNNLAAAGTGLPSVQPVFSGVTRRHASDNITISNPWTTSVQLGSDYRTEVTGTFLPVLSAGTTPKNSGTAIPGITDGFTGASPDRGALIEGKAQPVYGDRSGTAPAPVPVPTPVPTPQPVPSITGTIRATGTLTDASGNVKNVDIEVVIKGQ